MKLVFFIKKTTFSLCETYFLYKLKKVNFNIVFFSLSSVDLVNWSTAYNSSVNFVSARLLSKIYFCGACGLKYRLRRQRTNQSGRECAKTPTQTNGHWPLHTKVLYISCSCNAT